MEIPPTPALLSGPHSWGVILRGRRGAGKGPKAGTLPPFSPLLLKTSSQSTGDLPRPLPRGQKHPGLPVSAEPRSHSARPPDLPRTRRGSPGSPAPLCPLPSTRTPSAAWREGWSLLRTCCFPPPLTHCHPRQWTVLRGCSWPLTQFRKLAEENCGNQPRGVRCCGSSVPENAAPADLLLPPTQVVYYSEMHKIFGDLTQQLDQPGHPDEQRERENEARLSELRALSIVADD